ncbi:MAG: hypothetical protein HKN21_17480 [Candidatus Eisenbacteria bacterium]|uniref:Uncharacterized protein n=1 Tax=Eiseniibacteriota bacterium TaxID=2212470 RepID=A0A7Y2H487_UNCEI|nr:hypothetical protein [Candidatus Eisenbacteria bacterium]
MKPLPSALINAALIDAVKEPGVHLEGPKTGKVDAPLVLKGSFRLPKEFAQGNPVHRQLILSIQMGGVNGTCTPFAKTALFKDDAREDGKDWVGSFEIDMFQHIGLNMAGEFYAVASMGPLTSDVLKIEVT